MLKTALLQGNLHEPLKYRLGAVLDIKKGLWEICFHSITLKYSKPVYEFVTISCNYVQGEIINKDESTAVRPQVLAQALCSGSANSKKILVYKPRDYFEVNNAQQMLEIYFKKLDFENLPPNLGVEVTVLVLLRRKA